MTTRDEYAGRSIAKKHVCDSGRCLRLGEVHYARADTTLVARDARIRWMLGESIDDKLPLELRGGQRKALAAPHEAVLSHAIISAPTGGAGRSMHVPDEPCPIHLRK